ncbi:tetratricopeptide repeat protein [Bacillus sp. SB49]|nr:tetratricopeptide repeat protein [Bacillus sp. SB49]
MLKEIIKLIEDKEFKTAREKLLPLVRESTKNAELNYYSAVSHDALGMEREAIPFYEAALSYGINGELRERTYVQLGSSLRCIGEYQKSKAILEEGEIEYPDNLAIKAFLAIVMYNLNEEENSVRSLLETLVKTSSDPWINSYRKAIDFYSGKLNQTW